MTLPLLFRHHSRGRQGLAPPGSDCHPRCIYRTAANGGNRRARLTEAAYEVCEAFYGSVVDAKTDLLD